MQVEVKFVFSPRPQHAWNYGDVHLFIGGPCGLRIQETPHVNKNSIPITIFLLFFVGVIQLLVETNKYYSQYLDTLNNGGRCSWLPDMTDCMEDAYIFGYNNA
jgi:hypothetical protein